MTIAKTDNRSQYAGDGSTVAFVFPYRFFADGDLGVYVLASGVETKQTLTTNYTVSNTDTEDGGTVTFLVAPANGTVVTIIGETPLTQVADYTANDAFPALTHETALDRTVRLVQQQAEILGRAVVAPVSDTASLELPFDRANKFLAFDASKNPIATAGVSSVPVSGFMEDVLQADDAAAFFTAIDSASLAALSPLVPAADRLPYFTAADEAALTTLTAAGRAILDDADAAAQRATLGLIIGTNVQAYDADLAAVAALGSTGIAVRTASNTWAQRTITSADMSVTITNPGGVAGNIDLSVPSAPPTTSEVLAATAGAALGDVGSYALMTFSSNTTAIEGTTHAGSALRYSNAAGTSAGSAIPSGTWRLLGRTTNASAQGSTSLFLRTV